MLGLGIGVLSLAGAGGQGPEAPAKRAQNGACEPGLITVESRAVHHQGAPAYCLPRASQKSNDSRVNARYSKAATRVADFFLRHVRRDGNPATTAVCWNDVDWDAHRDIHALRMGGERPRWLGYRVPGNAVVNLSPRACGALDRITDGSMRPVDEDAAAALTVLAHETLHVAGIHAESVAECFAMQLVPRLAVELGLPSTYGQVLGKLRYEGHADRFGSTAYYGTSCARGLKHDLCLEPEIWRTETVSGRPEPKLYSAWCYR